MYNDTSLPLIFLGSNSNIYKLKELAESVGIQVLGIIDNDYHGQGYYKHIPVIGTEEDLQSYKDCQFICATNWTPDAASTRNKIKRARQLGLLQDLQLPLATLVSPLSSVSKHSKIAPGTAVYGYATIEPEVVVGAHSLIYDYVIVGHESNIAHNVVLQRQVLITSLVTVEQDVYFGLCSKAGRSLTTVAASTFVHPNVMLLRSTTPNEIISLASRKTYSETIAQ